MIVMAIICFQAPSLASALTGGAAVQQGIQMIQNAMMVAGLRAAAHRPLPLRAAAAGATGGVIRAGAGLPHAAGSRHRPRRARRCPLRRNDGHRCRRHRPQGLRPRPYRRLPPRRPERSRLTHSTGAPMKPRLRLAAHRRRRRRSAPGTSHAQGIPVIDIANLIQTIQQVMNDITKIRTRSSRSASCRARSPASTAPASSAPSPTTPLLQQLRARRTPSRVVNAVDASGYGGLTTTAKSLRDAGMVYNCLDLAGAARTSLPGHPRPAVPAEGPAAGRDDAPRPAACRRSTR